MSEEIFRHADMDGDVIRLERATTANPLLRAYVDSGNEFALLDRDAVLSLIQVLTEWAYPAHTPEGPNRSLIEELIAKAVKDQVSAVLPLHLSPVSSVRTRGGRCEGCRSGNHPHVFKACERTGCECLDTVAEHRPQECPGAGQCPEADPDPEPGDVGHPRPPAAEDGPCADPQCGHRRDRHRKACAVYTPGRGVCRCDVFQELEPLPERKTCPHGLGWSLRCRKCETPRLVEPIAFKPPYCGLCKQPWSDGHGQPGDPCPGVEEARQHPGDWTDALWRVQPSAPASEARYCDECGHSWEVHPERLVADTWCTAVKGKGRCQCEKRRPE